MKLKIVLFRIVLCLSICATMCYTVFGANPIVNVIDTGYSSNLEIEYGNITKQTAGIANLLFVNGDIIPEADAIIENGTTLVPLRVISERLNANVNWNSKTRTAEIQKGNVSISVPLGKKYIEVNGKNIETGAESRMINSLTYVPLRAISSCFGADVGFYNVGTWINTNTTNAINIIYVHDKKDKIIISKEEVINIAKKAYIEDFLPTINDFTKEVHGKNAIDMVKENFDFKVTADLGEYYYVTFFNNSIDGLFVDKYDGSCYPVHAFSACLFRISPVGEHLSWGLSFQ
ncbi:MAG: copper amine oxidase N-terminal domain-containing protein [Firmicutes bacterium]|nr:copper amine oxidase N-terminal domain-containing protein [Bacillota bacterium]